MIKKILSFTAAAVMVFSLSSCGNIADPFAAKEVRDSQAEETADTQEDPELDALNAEAKTCYNACAEYLVDMECKGIKPRDCIGNGDFALANSEEGLAVGNGADSAGQGDAKISEAASGFDGNRRIYIGFIDKDTYVDFYIQVKNSETGLTGQYPSPVSAAHSGDIVWTELYTPPVEDTAFGDDELDSAAKVIYNSVCGYLEIEEADNGVSMKESFENGAFGDSFILDPDDASLPAGAACVSSELPEYRGVRVHADIDDSGEPFVEVTNTDGNGHTGRYPAG